MKISSNKTLAKFRTPGKCEWCGKKCSKREPHHLWAKGFGGGGVLDIRINLIALGSTTLWQCPCHTDYHNGVITRDDMLAVVAVRENTRQDDIIDTINLLRRLDKDARPFAIESELRQMNGLASALARSVLMDAGKLERMAS